MKNKYTKKQYVCSSSTQCLFRVISAYFIFIESIHTITICIYDYNQLCYFSCANRYCRIHGDQNSGIEIKMAEAYANYLVITWMYSAATLHWITVAIILKSFLCFTTIFCWLNYNHPHHCMGTFIYQLFVYYYSALYFVQYYSNRFYKIRMY